MKPLLINFLPRNAFYRGTLPVLLAAALSGCASIIAGGNQSLSVATAPTPEANCQLSNSKGTWYVPETPGSTTVHRAADALVVTCGKGSAKGSTTVDSSVNGWVFGNIIFGLIGGAVGAIIDVSDGAAYDYPGSVNVPMVKP